MKTKMEPLVLSEGSVTFIAKNDVMQVRVCDNDKMFRSCNDDKMCFTDSIEYLDVVRARNYLSDWINNYRKQNNLQQSRSSANDK